MRPATGRAVRPGLSAAIRSCVVVLMVVQYSSLTLSIRHTACAPDTPLTQPRLASPRDHGGELEPARRLAPRPHASHHTSPSHSPNRTASDQMFTASVRRPLAALDGLMLHQVASHCIKWPHTALDGLTLHRRPHAASSGLTLHQVASRSVGWLHLDVHRTCCYLGLADAVCFRSVALGAETPKFNL